MKTMTARLLAAYLQGNTVLTSDLAELINTIHSALRATGKKGDEPAVVGPAVPIKKSVKPSAITCLECGKEFSMIKRHLATDHGLTPAEYRTKWSLSSDYPMTAPDYAARRSALAVKMGLGRKKALPEPVPAKPRRKKLGLNW
jgi:predicted transcriptional regulator